jgi:hypothetical protein
VRHERTSSTGISDHPLTTRGCSLTLLDRIQRVIGTFDELKDKRLPAVLARI